MLSNLTRIMNRKTGRFSSWDTSGRNADRWIVPEKSGVILADIPGPAQITHIWMTQVHHYRECLLKITYDNQPYPSVLAPLGDFFCLGHGMVNSFQSALFSASTLFPYQFNKPCALNCYVLMPFARRAVVELVNESDEPHGQYFYVDYEILQEFPADCGYFHAEFRRTNPFGGWGPEVIVNTQEADVVNKERVAWENNYVILETKGRGHYIGCNMSVTNFTRNWWGEGDDMIWVDGYKWPPDLHGTGSEDYFNQAYGMQPNAFLRNGSSIFEGGTIPAPEIELYRGDSGYQTSYVFHLENPVRFTKEIKATIEVGHANHLANEVSSVAYWYADRPTKVVDVPPVEQRLPVQRDNSGHWQKSSERECPGKPVTMTGEMKNVKAKEFSPLPRAEVVKAVERRNPQRIPLVMAKWWGEGFEALHGSSLKRFDKYPEDVVMVLIEPFDYQKMDLPWELKLTGAHDTRCVLDDWARLDEFIARLPDPEQDPQFEWAAEAAKKALAEDRYFLFGWWRLFFERPWEIRGMMNLLIDYMKYPEQVQRLCDALCDTYLAYLRRALREFPFDGFWTSDDLGYQKQLFMSPQTFRRILKPRYERIGKLLKEHGIHWWLHSCGNNTLIMGDLAEVGVNVFHPVQKHTMDERAIAAQFGERMSFLAGFDVQQILRTATPAEVRAEVRFLIDTFDRPEGGLCLAAGNGILPGTPLENVDAFLEEALVYGERKRNQ